MDYGDIIWRLWRKKRAIVGILLLGVVVGVLSYYKLSISPPRLESKATQTANAGVDVSVGTAKAPVALDANAFVSIGERTKLLAAVLISQPVREKISAKLGIPDSELTLATSADGADAASKGGSNTVVFTLQEGLPLLRVSGYTRTGPEAARVVNAAVEAAQEYVTEVQDSFRAGNQAPLMLKALDQPRPIVNVSGPSAKGAGVSGVAVGAVLLVLLLVVDIGLVNPPRQTRDRITA